MAERIPTKSNCWASLHSAQPTLFHFKWIILNKAVQSRITHRTLRKTKGFTNIFLRYSVAKEAKVLTPWNTSCLSCSSWF